MPAPDRIPNLRAWFSAHPSDYATIDFRGDEITTWRDKSGLGNDLFGPEGEGPLFLPDSLQQDRPVVTVPVADLGNRELASAANTVFIGSANATMHCFMAMRLSFVSGAALNRPLVIGTTAIQQGLMLQAKSDGQLNIGPGGNTLPKWNADFLGDEQLYETWHLWEIQLRSGEADDIRLWIDGTHKQFDVVGNSDPINPDPGMSLFRAPGSTVTGACSFGEIALYSRALNLKEQHDLRAYFANRWGFTITNSP